MTNRVMQVDPCKKYTNIPEARIIECLGILPFWAIQRTPDEGFKDVLERLYLAGSMHESKGATVLEDGEYKYPDDPTMWPLMRMDSEEEAVFFYEHAWVVIFNKKTKKHYSTRMD